MKIFKTERIIYFYTKDILKSNDNKDLSKQKNLNLLNTKEKNNDLLSNKFLTKKYCRFNVEKMDEYFGADIKDSKEGRWTLKEHIQFLQAINKFGTSWKNIKRLIPTRTSTQIRSHSQKFYKKLKKCKDDELGIDFTSDSINNVNDMINLIKFVNHDYDIVNVLLYMSGKNFGNKNSKKMDKIEQEVNINNIINDEKYFNDFYLKNNMYINKNYEKILINRETNDKLQNSNISFPLNNLFIGNFNMGNNNLDLLLKNYLNNNIIMNIINNNNFLYSNLLNLNNYYINNIQNDSSDSKNINNNKSIDNNINNLGKDNK